MVHSTQCCSFDSSTQSTLLPHSFFHSVLSFPSQITLFPSLHLLCLSSRRLPCFLHPDSFTLFQSLALLANLSVALISARIVRRSLRSLGAPSRSPHACLTTTVLQPPAVMFLLVATITVAYEAIHFHFTLRVSLVARHFSNSPLCPNSFFTFVTLKSRPRKTLPGPQPRYD